MEKTFPDKWIRKALFDLLDGIIVDGETISLYDTRVTGVSIPDHYILMTTQTAEVDKSNKCEYQWDSTIVLDITTTYKRPGNPGSRLLLDNITEVVREELEVNLDLSDGGLSVDFQTLSFPSDITTVTQTEIVYRRPLRLILKIN
jgi:hypothetical protein